MAADKASADPSAAAAVAPAAVAVAAAAAAEPRLPLGARPGRNAVIGAGLIAYAWVLCCTSPFSLKALLGVLLPGAVVGVIATAAHRSASRRRSRST